MKRLLYLSVMLLGACANTGEPSTRSREIPCRIIHGNESIPCPPGTLDTQSVQAPRGIGR